MTLKELIEKHGMGNGQRYWLGIWIEEAWFEPIFIARNERDVVGHTSNKDVASHLLCNEGWYLYEEPKKKVVRWKWAYKNGEDTWAESICFYTDKEADTHIVDSIKLTYTETSFEE